MKKIENYINGNSDSNSLKKNERKMKVYETFRKKIGVSEKIDIYMKGAFLAADAEIEMVLKRIDLVAAGLVIDYLKQSGGREKYKEYFNWS